MKIGAFITIFNDQWEKEFRPLFDIGLDFFEILPENPSVFTRKSLKQYLKNYEVIIHAPFIESNIISNSKIIREASKRYLLNALTPLIKDYSPKVITSHMGHTNAFIYSQVYLDEFKELIKKIPQLSVENMPGSASLWKKGFPGTEKEIDFVLGQVNCGFTFDVGHFLKGGCDIWRLLKKYLPRIVNIHIHDVVDGKDHQPLGTGILDVRKFVKILKDADYQGYLSIEMVSDNASGAISSFNLLKKLI
ncbi:MAG: sugar phosphate isomerase/epimerase [Patescibacteria group bacterium]|nr:sugar phosphate isomerase/epimerase [Actinomycetota bacterium]MCL5439077.1 sugar phosphate isomerase/epimerase [Patescibacteria group bacterium]